MKVNEELRNAIFEVIDNQINDNNPAETALTLKRLRDEGHSEFKARQLIGQAVAVELFCAMNMSSEAEALMVQRIEELNEKVRLFTGGQAS